MTTETEGGAPGGGRAELREVAAADDGVRLDRWFRRAFPGLAHGRLEKLLRTGQIRVDGRRAKSGTRLAAGQRVRIPPGLSASAGAGNGRRRDREGRAALDPADREAVRAMVVHMDREVIVLNKPPGLAVQGGTRTRRHLDGMLEALATKGGERPRLVHRLDRDTSGLLIVARSAAAAARLGAAFRAKRVRKVYWALTAGVPELRRGEIDLAVAKRAARGGERMAAGPEGAGQAALTRYAVVEAAGRRAAWLALMPLTGRTHQLRVHCAAIGTPIVGDAKYGGKAAFLPGDELERRLHLHARRLTLPHPGGGTLDVVAALPPHMRRAWRFFGFDPEWPGDPFEEIAPAA